jgi:hypothetical protein
MTDLDAALQLEVALAALRAHVAGLRGGQRRAARRLEIAAHAHAAQVHVFLVRAHDHAVVFVEQRIGNDLGLAFQPDRTGETNRPAGDRQNLCLVERTKLGGSYHLRKTDLVELAVTRDKRRDDSVAGAEQERFDKSLG